jgi:hypothetical protein
MLHKAMFRVNITATLSQHLVVAVGCFDENLGSFSLAGVPLQFAYGMRPDRLVNGR